MNLLIDFDALARNAKTAARRMLSLFQRAGLEVVDAAHDGKVRRTAGVSFRELVLSFADSQTLTLRIKATGDVYQVLLNGKVTPLAEQDDAAKAVAELVKLLDKSRAKHQKRLAALAMKPPEGIKTAAPKLEQKLTEQIAEVDAQIESAREELAALQG